MRSAAGISSNNASMLGAPIAASISRTSASVCGMNGMSVPRLLDDLLVGSRRRAGSPSSPLLLGFTLNSQPWPYGSLFTSSGVALSASLLLAMTSPDTGL